MNYRCFETLSDGILILDSERKLVYFNSNARFLEKRTQIKLQIGNPVELDFDETERKVEVTIHPFVHQSIPGEGKWFVIVRDLLNRENVENLYREEIEKKEKAVKDLHEVQDQLTQFSKAAIIGQFIASITHELNNPLTFLLSSVEDLTRALNDDEFDLKSAKALTENVNKGAFRILQITNHLKTFLHSPLSIDQLVYTDLYNIIEKAIAFTHHITLKNKILVKNQIPKNLPHTLVDPSLIEQVAINLIRNSVDALLDSKKIENRTIEILGKFNDRTQTLTLSFVDHGPGISKDTRNKLFTPFFTTKEIGKGTGLGLSICVSIAAKHEGTLTLSETRGGGATFQLTLPVKSPRNHPIRTEE